MKKLIFKSINNYLKDKYKYRVYKVSVDGGFSCPNRKNSKGCIFCDEKGASSQTNKINTPIKEQVLNNILIRKSRFRAQKFIVYFQSFTNTYADTTELKKKYDEALYAHKDIIGISISTRADTIDEEKIKLIASYKKKFPYVSIEYGLQSVHDKTLKKINRKESFTDFIKAIYLTKKYHLEHCVHVILGLLDETVHEQIQTAESLKKLKIQGVKIHPLMVLKNTVLEKLYNQKKYTPLFFEEYISICADFLKHLNSDCIIHRVSTSGRPEDIIAPIWTREKKEIIHFQILKALQEKDIYFT